MRYRKGVAAALLAVVFCCCAGEMTLTRGEREIVFGGPQFSVAFDAKTGTWKRLTVAEGDLLATPRTKIPFDLVLTKAGRRLSAGDSDYRLAGIEQRGENSVALTIEVGALTAECIFELQPEQGMLRHFYSIANRGRETLTVHRFLTAPPRAKFTAESFYSCPVLFPRIGRRGLKDFTPGRTIQNWRDPCATIVQLSPRRTVMTMVDRGRPYADITRTAVTELPNGVALEHTVEASGYLRPGERWQIGDFYCRVLEADGDAALRSIHEWMAGIGMTVPADRNPASRRVRLYSFHPGQPGHPFQDWGGFVPSTKQLPRIRALNCNTVWILPVESECPYIPDDFYRMANGIGTPEEYRALVDTAHLLGMRVWQDVVPHGGRNTCRRAVEHPEWLLRDEAGNVPRVRCFDYNHPEWRDYLGEVVRFYTRTYRLDGWRIDTGGFSFQPNWSRNIPYGRGSWAMGQGGLAMMKMIRDRARQENPAAITLSECDGSIYGTAADLVYDFPLCRQVFRSLRTLPPERFVRELSCWLDEQNYAELADQIRLRYIESHDEPKAELLYGPEALRAGMALTAWIHGVPMIYKEMEDGHSAIFRRIMKLRDVVPVLSEGGADYRSCRATPGVFCCLRSDARRFAIPVINFNSVAVNAEVEIPSEMLPDGENLSSLAELWNGRTVPLRRERGKLVAACPLPAYGFTLLAPAFPAVETREPEPEAGIEPLPCSGFYLAGDGVRLPFAVREGISSCDAVPGRAVVLRIDGGGEPLCWRARSACGTVGDRFRTRHPFYNSMRNNMYSLPSGHNVLWSSVQQPFGFTEREAELLFWTTKGSLRISFPPEERPAGVFLLDRIGEDHAPHLVIVKGIPDTPLAAAGTKLSWRVTSGTAALTGPEETRSGDSRLRRIAGGWWFDNGNLRLRIASNGSLLSAQQRRGGLWRSIVDDLQLDLRSGYVAGSTLYSSANEMETFQLLEKRRSGTLQLNFFGRPRGRSYYQILPPNALNYQITYTLDDSAGFGFACAVRPVTAPSHSGMMLALNGRLAAGTPLRLVAGNPAWLTHRDDAFSFRWFDGGISRSELGIWNVFAAKIGGEAAEPRCEFAGRGASSESGGVLDPSFELEYQGAFPDTVQMYCYALPWLMPYGSSVTTEAPRHGKRAVRIDLTGREEQRLKQQLTGTTMRPGERWRLSVWVKARGLRGSRLDLRLHTPFHRWADNRNCLSRPVSDGSYDYRLLALEFTVPEKLENWELQLGGRAASGTVWFDDLRLEKVK